MLAAAFQRGGQGQQLRLPYPRRGLDGMHGHLPLGQGTCLIQHNAFDMMEGFQHLAVAEQNAVLRAHARADHNGNGRRQPKRARAGNDKYGNEARKGKRKRLPNEKPDDKGNKRNRHNDGHKNAAHPVRELGNGGLAVPRLLHKLYNAA